MSSIDTSNVTECPSRPRRLLQSPNKSYDGDGERNLELPGILKLLSDYREYEGGINCCRCGKLYKSKVCFIKHLWEHSVYWDLFPGDKNHERVLAIQAALILYSRYLNVTQEDADRLKDLLVTSPTGHEVYVSQSTPKRVPLAPPLTPTRAHPNTQSTPKKVLPVSLLPKNPYLDIQTTPKKVLPLNQSTLKPMQPVFGLSSPCHLEENVRRVPYPLSPVTPEKDFEPVLVCPATPRKDRRKLMAAKMQRTARRKRRLLLD